MSRKKKNREDLDIDIIEGLEIIPDKIKEVKTIANEDGSRVEIIIYESGKEIKNYFDKSGETVRTTMEYR